MLTKFFILLAITIILIATWFMTTIIFQVDHRDYLDLTAPVWHMTLHAAWLVSLFVTSMQGASLLLDMRSRQRRKLTEQPPQ